MKTILTLLTLSLLLFAGCSEDDASPALPSLEVLSEDIVLYGVCEHTTHPDPIQRQCREWYGDFFEIINLELTCSAITNGNFSLTNCDQEKMVGFCEVPIISNSRVKFFYYQDDWTPEAAQSHCETKYQLSVWVPAAP